MPVVTGFPAGIAQKSLTAAVENFERAYGTHIKIISATYQGYVTTIDRSVDAMMRQMAVIDEATPGVMRIAETAEIAGRLSPATLDTLRQNLDLNLSVGDYLVAITLKELATKKEVTTLNSIDPDGKAFSGVFFLTTATPGGGAIGVHRPNTNCKTFVLANYIFTNTPKVSLDVCVRAVCEGGRCTGCLITQAKGNLGPCAELECFPQPTGGQPAVGTIAGNCCIGTVGYAWATGFKSVKVSVDAGRVKFEIEGFFGRGDTGFVSVEECCSGPTRPPPETPSAPTGAKPKPATGTTPSGAAPSTNGIAPVTSETAPRRRTCANAFPGAIDCINEGFVYETLKQMTKVVERIAGERIVHVDEKLQDDRGPCPKLGYHYDFYGKSGDHHGSGFGCPCCDDLPDPEGPTMKHKYKYNG